MLATRPTAPATLESPAAAVGEADLAEWMSIHLARQFPSHTFCAALGYRAERLSLKPKDATARTLGREACHA